MAQRNLIVNADDFGASVGVNRGIVHAHVEGIVTSTSLMVHGRAAQEAVALAREHPGLAVGLHGDLDAGGVDRGRSAARPRCASSWRHSSRRSTASWAVPPSHIDSHHHVHRSEAVAPIAEEVTAPLGVPLRESGLVTYIGGFYGQWEWQVTDLQHVSPDFLVWILRNEVEEGWTEIGCHPGYIDDDFTSVYFAEREAEVRTLTDPRIREEIDALGIRLASYDDL